VARQRVEQGRATRHGLHGSSAGGARATRVLGTASSATHALEEWVLTPPASSAAPHSTSSSSDLRLDVDQRRLLDLRLSRPVQALHCLIDATGTTPHATTLLPGCLPLPPKLPNTSAPNHHRMQPAHRR
jgi:hypothetical protein